MTGRLSGKNSIKTKLIRLLAAGNSLLMFAVALLVTCYQLVAGRQSNPFSMLLFSAWLLICAGIGVAGLCWLLSCRIKQLISEPIGQLAKKMEIVSRSQDYMVRVKRCSDDELGLLFDCFNGMLAEISSRDERLALHSQELRQEVADRTRELSSVNRQLAESLDEVRRAMQAAQSASRAKSDFLAQMSHEIRTPMCGVLGMTELLQNTDLSKQQLRYVERVKNSGEALLCIINDILDFSKIEAGRMELEAIPFDLHELVSETLEMFYEDAGKKGLELAFDIAAEVPRPFIGDPGRLRQVLVNLIGNAVKFTTYGYVRLAVLMERKPDLVRISISDTGIGIKPEEQARIFNRFTQCEESMTHKYGGTGLGLAIVRQLTELMGGELSVVSEPGKGSTFSFTTSLESLSEQGWVWPERISMTFLRGKKALVASDAAAARASMRGQLSGWGMDVVCVEDAAGALSRLVADHFDLAVIDQRVTGADGIELAATIRSMPTGHCLRLVLLADADFWYQRERAQQLGVFLFRKKSLGKHGLYQALLSAFGMKPVAGEENSSGIGPLALSPMVLLVEDSTVNQEVGRDMLESLGCVVELVDNGLSALQAVQRASYDLIFMDCEMPEMDGIEATRRIRKWEESQGAARPRRIPIVALTAYAMQGDRMACLASGADDYLSKPYTREDLSRLITRYLGDAPPSQAQDAANADEAISRDRMTGALEIIRQLPGNRGMEILRKVVGLYLASTPTLLQTMREAESGGDAEKLKSAAHSFKSSSANLGAVKLADVCLELETLVRAGSTEGALPLLMKLEAEYMLVRDALQGESLC